MIKQMTSVALITLALTGCSGGSDAGSEDNATRTPAQPAVETPSHNPGSTPGGTDTTQGSASGNQTPPENGAGNQAGGNNPTENGGGNTGAGGTTGTTPPGGSNQTGEAGTPGTGDNGGVPAQPKARTWQEGFTLSNPGTNASNPDVVTLPDGTVIATWVESNRAVYAARLRADLPADQQKRSLIDIRRLDDNLGTVQALEYGRYRVALPKVQVAATPDGIAHVAWSQKVGYEGAFSVYVSTWRPETGEWSGARLMEGNLGDARDIQFFTHPSGQVVLFWREKHSDTGTWHLVASVYDAGTDGWRGPVILTESMAASDYRIDDLDLSVWPAGDKMGIAWLEQGSDEQTTLRAGRLSLPDLKGQLKDADTEGTKISVAGTHQNGQDMLFWSEKDELGHASLMAARTTPDGWHQYGAIEELPYDITHLSAVTVNDAAWVAYHRPSSRYGTGLDHKLYIQKYLPDSDAFSDPALVGEWIADPYLQAGGDGHIYLSYASLPNRTLIEYAPDGTKLASNRYCHANLQWWYSGCNVAAKENRISVSGRYGAAVTRTEIEEYKVIGLSLSVREE